MGIAQAIARVKKGVREGGIPAVMAELGEQLRSDVIPQPFRPAAVRLAALLRAGVPAEAAEGSAPSIGFADPARDTLPSTPVFGSEASACPMSTSAVALSAVAQTEPEALLAQPVSTGAESEISAPEGDQGVQPKVQSERPRAEAKPRADAKAKPARAKASRATAPVPAKSASAPRAAKPAKPSSEAKPSRPAKREKEKPQAQEELARNVASATTLARPNAKPLSKRPSAKVVSSKRK